MKRIFNLKNLFGQFPILSQNNFKEYFLGKRKRESKDNYVKKSLHSYKENVRTNRLKNLMLITFNTEINVSNIYRSNSN